MAFTPSSSESGNEAPRGLLGYMGKNRRNLPAAFARFQDLALQGGRPPPHARGGSAPQNPAP